MQKIAATVLAAGLGQRFGGKPKAAFKVGAITMLEHSVFMLRQAGIREIRVVIGPYQETLLPLVARSEAKAVIHQKRAPSLIDSQRIAVSAHVDQSPNCDLLLVLVDLCLLIPQDVADLVAHWRQRAKGIQVLFPVVDGVRGHPLLIASQAAQAIHQLPRNLGIRAWLSTHPAAVLTLPMPSERQAYIRDVDTEVDLIAIQRHIQHQKQALP